MNDQTANDANALSASADAATDQKFRHPALFCDNCGHYPLEPIHGHFMCSVCHMPTKCCEGAPLDQ